MSRNDNRRDDDNRRDGRDRDRDRDQDRDRDRRRDRDHDRDDRDRDRDRNRGGSLRAGADERRGFGAPPPARPHGRRSVFDDGDYDGAAIAKEAVPQGATGEDDGKKSTFRYRQGLQFVDQVPDFLKGLIKPKQPMYNPNGDSDDEGGQRRAPPVVENNAPDREDRDDEAPEVVVLKSGDLSKDEVDVLKQKKAEEESNKPAGPPGKLSKGPGEHSFAFKAPPKDAAASSSTSSSSSSPSNNAAQKIKKPKLLSFSLDE